MIELAELIGCTGKTEGLGTSYRKLWVMLAVVPPTSVYQLCLEIHGALEWHYGRWGSDVRAIQVACAALGVVRSTPHQLRDRRGLSTVVLGGYRGVVVLRHGARNGFPLA